MNKTRRNLIIAIAFLIPVLLTYLVFIPFLLLYAVMIAAWLGGWPEWLLVIIIPSGAVFLCLIPQRILNKAKIKFLNSLANFFLSLMLNISPLIITVFISATFF